MHLRRAIVFLVALLVAASCGDSNEADAPGNATTAPPTTNSVSAAPVSDADTESDDADMSPENCPQLVAAISGAANAAAAAVAGSPDADLPVENMRALAGRIPEISDDLTIVADAYEDFLQRLQDLGVDLQDPSSLFGLDPEVMEQVAEAGAALDQGAVAEANQNIQAFFERECS